MAQSTYASSGLPIDATSFEFMEREALPLGMPSAITKYPWEAISAMAAELESPFSEQPPSPHTKMGYFSVPPRSMGRKMVPSTMPLSAFVSTTTLCGPVPETFAQPDYEAVQVPVVVLPPVPVLPPAALLPPVAVLPPEPMVPPDASASGPPLLAPEPPQPAAMRMLVTAHIDRCRAFMDALLVCDRGRGIRPAVADVGGSGSKKRRLQRRPARLSRGAFQSG